MSLPSETKESWCGGSVRCEIGYRPSRIGLYPVTRPNQRSKPIGCAPLLCFTCSLLLKDESPAFSDATLLGRSRCSLLPVRALHSLLPATWVRIMANMRTTNGGFKRPHSVALVRRGRSGPLADRPPASQQSDLRRKPL